MRVETQVSSPSTPTVSSPAADKPAAQGESETNPSNGLARPDRFDSSPKSGWRGFEGGRRVATARVMQAKAEPAPPADVGPRTSLPDAVFRRADQLPKDKTHAPVRDLYAQAETAAKGGDYGAAADKLDRALSRYEEEIDGSKALGNGGVGGTRNLVNQYRVMADMKARGVNASSPPSQTELESYFKTFDNKADRPKALAAYREYSDAFHVHPANVGRGNQDVVYSKDPAKYAHGNKLYDREADAQKAQARRGGDITEFQTADASSWKEVTTDRAQVKLAGGHPEHAGKSVNDCEGYAYTAQTLLGAAGYRSEQVAVQSKNGEQHAMTVFTDPSRPKSVAVTSNGKVFQASSRKAALDAGFADAMPPESKAGPYFGGKTQHEAQVKMLFHYRDAP